MLPMMNKMPMGEPEGDEMSAGDGGHTHPSLEARIAALEAKVGIGDSYEGDAGDENDADLNEYLPPVKKGPLYGR
jgi:hypothetical protein